MRRRNRHYDDLEAPPEQPQTPVDMFRIGTFVVIVDSIASELEKRLAAYAEIAAMFGFMRTLKNLSNEKLIECAIKLERAYPTDLEDSLSDELLHFSSFLKTDFAEKWFEVSDVPTTPAVSSKEQSATSSDESDINEADDDNDLLCVESIELRLIVVNNLETVFPNTVIVLQTYLSLMISNYNSTTNIIQQICVRGSALNI